MIVSAEIVINKSKDSVWKAITDIENWKKMLSSIIKINILYKPSEDFVGLKWEETREMFGKEEMETMWVTDSVENEYYCTRAESHGSVYITKLSLGNSGTGTLLTISFNGIAKTNVAKILLFSMGPFIRKSIIKALTKDLEDIKHFVEKN
ncbi:MAG: SRPBCC family protein [Deltaproteobacteria bacterium]|nr:SRPBCC family protein [Deltaproteobacteria bacterium]